MLPVTGAAEGDALTELLGLNKSPSLNLGEAVGLAAGLGVASVCAKALQLLPVSSRNWVQFKYSTFMLSNGELRLACRSH